MTPRWKCIVLSVLVLAFGAGIFGCSGPRPFSNLDLARNRAQLESIQFHLSSRIVLSRKIAASEYSVVSSEHVIKSVRGMKIVEVELEKGTCGVAVGTAGDTLLVSFEPAMGGRERCLRFVPDTRPVSGDEPASYVLETDGSGLVMYMGESWELAEYHAKRSVYERLDAVDRVVRTAISRPRLLVKSETSKIFDKRSRVLPGRTVN
ncbi:MAG: hypothetical protein KAW17_10200 [Candidatus Eisenbacteria sp.]|nr:hypothetical protein [Candidatus Eisenbacteria bacterium]